MTLQNAAKKKEMVPAGTCLTRFHEAVAADDRGFSIGQEFNC
jgi:hypothetical protein